ncbi:MAG: protein kinase, partial [Planctomycetes bacterium]|nr:protein kinase [Planctomycetota bacterium]
MTDAFPEIPGYRLTQLLGQGGSAEVYLGSQSAAAQSREVAVKVLRRGIADRRHRAAFDAERRALARLAHNGVPRVIDAGETVDGRPFLVMEHIVGESITEFCARQALPVTQRIRLLLGACDAIAHAHVHAVLHGDLKPDHLLVDGEGAEARVRVIDFGLARVDGGPGTGSRGTLHYVSPEVLRGAATDVRAEVWALGVVLFELLTGRHPAAGADGIGALLAAADQLELPRCADLPGGACRDLRAIVATAVAVEPARRYPSVRAFAADLQGLLLGQSVAARQPGPIERAVRVIRRHRAAFMAAAAIGIAFVWAAVVLVERFVDARAALAAAREAREFAAKQERAERASLRRFDVLAGVPGLRRVEAAAERLGPPWPEHAAAMRQWLERDAAPLLTLRAQVPQARADAEAADNKALGAFLRRTLDDLERALQQFATTRVPQVKRQLAWAGEVEQRSVTEHRAAWQRAIREVEGSPRYSGVKLVPQLGLVPLGADPRSGLQEFAHLASGALPHRSADGALVCGPESGIVFVLLPPGTARIGTPQNDPVLAREGPGAGALERPVHTVRLDAFLIGKHEVSQ